MFVKAKVNGKRTHAIADLGASHNFIKKKDNARLGISLKKGQWRLKTMNSKAKSLDGVWLKG